MRLSSRFPTLNGAGWLLIAVFLAFALVSPVAAEPGSPPPSASQPGSEAEANPQAEQTPPEGTQPDSADAESVNPETAKPDARAGATQPEAEAAPVQAGSQILINIDKSLQEMTVFVDGIEKYTWPVSTGKRGYSTPSGTYSATSMNKIWYSKEWDNAPMPHAIFYMKDGHAIHGTQEVKNLGRPASHGCVRLAPKNAATLFDLVEKNGMSNTQVVLTGTTPGGEAKVASEEQEYPGYGNAAPWPGARGYYYPPPPNYYPRQQKRRLFGRWLQPYPGPQGYYRQPRGYYPRGY